MLQVQNNSTAGKGTERDSTAEAVDLSARLDSRSERYLEKGERVQLQGAFQLNKRGEIELVPVGLPRNLDPDRARFTFGTPEENPAAAKLLGSVRSLELQVGPQRYIPTPLTRRLREETYSASLLSVGEARKLPSASAEELKTVAGQRFELEAAVDTVTLGSSPQLQLRDDDNRLLNVQLSPGSDALLDGGALERTRGSRIQIGDRIRLPVRVADDGTLIQAENDRIYLSAASEARLLAEAKLQKRVANSLIDLNIAISTEQWVGARQHAAELSREKLRSSEQQSLLGLVAQLPEHERPILNERTLAGKDREGILQGYGVDVSTMTKAELLSFSADALQRAHEDQETMLRNPTNLFNILRDAEIPAALRQELALQTARDLVPKVAGRETRNVLPSHAQALDASLQELAQHGDNASGEYLVSLLRSQIKVGNFQGRRPEEGAVHKHYIVHDVSEALRSRLSNFPYDKAINSNVDDISRIEKFLANETFEFTAQRNLSLLLNHHIRALLVPLSLNELKLPEAPQRV